MEDIFIGTQDRSVPIFIPDPASTTGAGKTGLNAAAITVHYTRYETDNDVVGTDVTSSVNDLSALTDAHNDWGWKEVSSTLAKGQYRLDVADAVFATGAWYAVVQVTITSGTAAATPKAFRLINRNDLTDTAQTGDAYAIVNSGTHGNAALKTLIDALDDFVDTEVAAIKAKTDNLPSDPADASDVAAAIAALNDVSAAEVNAEVVDALNVDTYAQTTGVPASTTTLQLKISRLYDALINPLQSNSGKLIFKNAAGTAQWEKDLADDGTDYTESAGNAP